MVSKDPEKEYRERKDSEDVTKLGMNDDETKVEAANSSNDREIVGTLVGTRREERKRLRAGMKSRDSGGSGRVVD